MISQKKIAVIAVCAAVFVCLSGVSWALVDSHFREGTPEQIRDTTMQYIADNHPETVQFMDNFEWTGGIVQTELLGAGQYIYESQGWTVKISYPIVANPTYQIEVNYSVPSGIISIPYSVNWAGTWENSALTETDYVFAQ